jgi:hypothetical protein
MSTVFKALKLEVLVLTDALETDTEILRVVDSALSKEYRSVVVKIKESHEKIIADIGRDAEA